MSLRNKVFRKHSGRRATWRNAIIAEAAHTTRVDGYEYFPPDSVDWDRLVETPETSLCAWKGLATYIDVRG